MPVEMGLWRVDDKPVRLDDYNGEGSIYPVKDGYRGYVWCTSPDGTRYRKYVKGKTYEATQQAWLKLRDTASRGLSRRTCLPSRSSSPTGWKTS